jgi:hypothetical protein
VISSGDEIWLIGVILTCMVATSAARKNDKVNYNKIVLEKTDVRKSNHCQIRGRRTLPTLLSLKKRGVSPHKVCCVYPGGK